MDILSDVLSAVRLKGAFYFEVTATAPWVSANPAMTDIGSMVMPDSEHVIPFHVMLDGDAWAWPDNDTMAPAPFQSGDIVVFPSGSRHVISSEPAPSDRPPVNLEFYRDASRREAPFTIVEIGEASAAGDAKFVCGYLGCDLRPFNPLLDALPEMLIVPALEGSRELTDGLIRSAVQEARSGGAGSQTILARLSELLFLQALRRYVENMPEKPTGWLSGLRDARISAALQAIHADPAADWTLEGLARRAGMSRSKLAEHFAAHTGESPMRYLTRWRMQLASRLLEDPQKTIAAVAEQVGYGSEAAFKRTFKKVVGEPPGAWRRRRPSPGSAAPHSRLPR